MVAEENVEVIYASCIQQVENSIKHQREYVNVLSSETFLEFLYKTSFLIPHVFWCKVTKL
jgi:hypothetical protein